MERAANSRFEDWPCAALLLDAHTGRIVAATAPAVALLEQVGDSLVGRSLASLLGASVATQLLSSHRSLAAYIPGHDDRTLCLLVRSVPAMDGNGTIVLLEDITQLRLGEATALAMAGVMAARAEAKQFRDYAQRCAEALVVSGLAKKAAMLVREDGRTDFSIYGSIGWSRDELPALVAAVSNMLPLRGGRGKNSLPDWLVGDIQSPEIANTGFVPLTCEENVLGVLAVAPWANWQASGGVELLGSAVSEGLAELLSRRPASALSGISADSAAVAARCVSNVIEALSCPGHALSARDRCERILETLCALVSFEQAAVVARTGDNGAFAAQFVYPTDREILTCATSITARDATLYGAVGSGHTISGRLCPEETGPLGSSLWRAGVGPWVVAPLDAEPDRTWALFAVRRVEAADFTSAELGLLRVVATLLSRLLSAKYSLATGWRQDRRATFRDRRSLLQLRVAGARAAADFFTHHLRALETTIQQALDLSRGQPAEEAVLRVSQRLRACLCQADRIDACWDVMPDEALEPVSLAQIVREALQEALGGTGDDGAAPLPTHHITTHITTEEHTLGQRGRLLEAVRALLDNALQAMPHGGRLTVSLDRCGPWLRLLLADTGVGIAPSLWEAVFQPFFTTLGVRHAGLGLTFVDAVVAKHKGVTLICSDVCEGTTVALYLPAVPEPL
ncbi:MAG: ATP-binding protein [Armatimonadetes bacterium]|nr:ATP-binding protein [Armatimonadota bacterium]